MSDCRRQWNREDELPVYLAGPIPTGPNQRKTYGMFSSVEGAFESKTIDFDNYAVGRKGSRTPRSGRREMVLDAGDPVGKTSSEAREGSLTNSPGDTDDQQAGVEVRYSSGKESPNGEVGLRIMPLGFFFYLSGFLVEIVLVVLCMNMVHVKYDFH
ncbi:30S ribosomal protein S3 [Dissostichus eleginoides]|uniref:30S ribosomal protein S3 n=1 Tax=Dissostichus eleginoides TaxID=100907 RepID=A0AAD9F205_DISEL|nr:30S ribosomal protein S3 [Dissostichus eleginoides]